MTRISRRHPRYGSLVTRARLAAASRSGLVAPEGLIAQGRGEAFDYFLGERTSPGARRAIRAAAVWLVRAHHPVLSVNGNVAALAAPQIAELVRALPRLAIEVNLFHRTQARARAVAAVLAAAGVSPVLGVRPTAVLAGLPSDRARIDARGIARADVCVVPLEDGDRTAALRAAGKRVIAIDLNPLSRTARQADLPIIDELTRALDGLARAVRPIARDPRRGAFPPFDRQAALTEALDAMINRLASHRRPTPRRRRRGPSRRPSPGTARPSHRTRR